MSRQTAPGRAAEDYLEALLLLEQEQSEAHGAQLPQERAEGHGKGYARFPKGRRTGFNYMNRQMDLILNTDWANAFQRQALPFGKADAAHLIRKSFGALRPVA